MTDKGPDKLTDREYLREGQYKDSSNLNARTSLHEEFSTNPYGFHRWVFDLLEFPRQCRVLEIGCGPATLWTHNLDRISPSWSVTLTDLSHGMVETARYNLSPTKHRFTYAVGDA